MLLIIVPAPWTDADPDSTVSPLSRIADTMSFIPD
jgi:hypothetical protein